MKKITPKKEIKSLSVEKKIDKLESAITKLIVTNDKRFDSIDKTLNAHNDRFESLDKRFDSIDKTLNAHNDRFESLDKRFDSIDSTLKVHSSRFESIDNRFGSLENSIDELAQITANGFFDINKRFDDFKAETEKNFVTVRRDILSTNDRFVMQDTYYKKISLIESRLDNHDDRITKIMNKESKNTK
jgi:chromosome segregation ATPase